MQIELPTDACNAFRNSISAYIKRKRKRLEKKLDHNSRSNNNNNNAKVVANRLSKAYQNNCNLVTHLTDHAIHILTTLYIKRHSLSLGIQAFQMISNDCIQTLHKVIMPKSTSSIIASSSFPMILQKMLKHLFIQYIHLCDGFVLLTSGECRHDADAIIAKNVKYNNDDDDELCVTKSKGSIYNHFPSKLNELETRNDGYTKLYSSKCGYSGYGYDEFFNEEIGVRKRLLDMLRKCSTLKPLSDDNDEDCTAKAKVEREEIWEKLDDLGNGAQAFDAAFDTHIYNIQELKSQLESIRKKLLDDLQKILSPLSASKGGNSNVAIIMNTEDKFEKLQLVNANALGVENWCIQRQGNDFRGNDKRGALPSRISIKDWLKIMKLPSDLQELGQSNTNKKNSTQGKECDESTNHFISRKRKKGVILDSDDSDDDDGADDNGSNNKKDTKRSQCLKETIKEVSATTQASSLDMIKEQLGVNVDQLQRSREELEQEEMISKKAAFLDEIGEGDDEINIGQDPNHHSNIEITDQSDRIKSRNPGVGSFETINLTYQSKDHHTSLPRNDLFRNASMQHRNREPTERIVIGGDYRNSTYTRNEMESQGVNPLSSSIPNNNADKDFREFGNNDSNADYLNDEKDSLWMDKQDTQVVYRKWGDELLESMGIDVENLYPSCAPEMPPEMIKSLGLQS